MTQRSTGNGDIKDRPGGAPRGRAALAALLLAAAATACATDDGAPQTAPKTPEASGKATRTPGPAQSAAGGHGSRPGGFTLVASGDVLPHDSVIRRASVDAGGDGYDFRPMLAGAKPVVSKADVAICHMETVYGENGAYTGYPTFKSPPEVATALGDAGYDSCSTASNHTLDDGAAGVRRTLDALDGAGVRHTGSARSANEAQRPALMDAGGAKVAHLAYTYGTNGAPLPAGQPWAVNRLDAEKVVADAKAARRAGADVVVVSPHWGTEWQDEPDARQLALAEQLTAAKTEGRPDIDLIIGTHAHVPQAYEKVNGTWVVYGMGDQIAGAMINHAGEQDPRGNQSSMGRFTFAPPAQPGERWTVRRAEFLPMGFDPDAGRVTNLGGDAGDADLAGIRDRIQQVVLGRGAGKQGLVMGK
ncbi:Capsule biosynthesis protein CapA [Streptomyces sp. YIM 130001]|uniref:CapA family protein n=1 Tax=Streptomyces sp. YIM 130001 TaxID=2259644 RepID=UPI000E64F695|nr:CapA family protein [Streptomyces sp. YIM 130001]RII20272.1 Capsule biosynthesis protein CapA [Streptomyces sp. YIM 130001]